VPTLGISRSMMNLRNAIALLHVRERVALARAA
jgi:hypothetical protein